MTADIVRLKPRELTRPECQNALMVNRRRLRVVNRRIRNVAMTLRNIVEFCSWIGDVDEAERAMIELETWARIGESIASSDDMIGRAP